jgi:Firmicute plasmid replication protein (RepL)
MADVIRLGAKRKRRMSDFYEEDWGCWRGEAFVEIGKHREFTGETLRVLFVLIGCTGRANRIMISPEQTADELGIRKDRVTAQMKKLAEAGILLKAKYDWRLNPRYGFKGEPDKDLRRAPGGELVLVD